MMAIAWAPLQRRSFALHHGPLATATARGPSRTWFWGQEQATALVLTFGCCAVSCTAPGRLWWRTAAFQPPIWTGRYRTVH